MKKKALKLFVFALAISLVSTSCEKDSDTEPTSEPTPESTEITVSENITSNTTWETGKTYTLASRIAVVDGITLTIQPGVIVKGEAGSGTNATALVIAQGAKIMAEGTAAAPIIFTSIADEIIPGEIESPNLNTDLNGLWGGLIVLGKAPISPKSNGITSQIEGIPTSDANGLYGGSTADDNSGVIKYVSIRHGGTNIGQDNEINGLTLGGVGSGTVIENIEIVANQDDGIEFFGGTVSVKNALVLNNGDDAIDTDQAWAGTLDNFMVINPGDKAFELDGPEGTYTGAGHTIKNGTVYMLSCAGGYDDDDNTNAIVSNILFTKITHNTGMSNDYNANGSFTCSGLEFDITPVDLDDDSNTPDEAPVASDYFADMTNGEITEVTTASVGADKSVFTGWTAADKAGEL
ncbi:MAG: hypothetical protein U9R32_06000 [Bacteroidota bacterium]|nr:hypothetical protein [Bacteroidota bacterium]